MKSQSNKKAQIFSLDMIIAVITMALILITIALTWEFFVEKNRLLKNTKELSAQVQDISSFLVSTKGSPENWEALEFSPGNVKAIGLCKEPGILDAAKLDKFFYSDYNTTKQILRLSGNNFDLEILISVWNGTGYGPTYSMGNNLTSARYVIAYDRFALLENRWAKIQLKVAKNE